jgi:carboxyl-terminal processing protease
MKHIDFKKLGLGTVAVILFFAVIGGTYFVGYTRGTQETKRIVVEGVVDPQISKDGIDFTPFWEAWSALKSRFVSKEKTDNNQALLYGAISGMVSAVDDPYTVFFTPQDAGEFNQEISGEFSGIGAEIGKNKDDQIVIIAPLKGTPAERAGIQAGDRIAQIDGESTFGLSVEQAVDRIRGKKGTNVTLTLVRNDREIEQKITRDTIVLPTLDLKILNRSGQEDEGGSIGYVRLYNFYEKAPAQFRIAAGKIASKRNIQGIILDVRGNPGGYLEAATYIAGWFVERGKTVVREEFRNSGENREIESRGPSAFENTPVIVLVDKGSASAAEILAGALQEAAGATVMGEQSFGKGTVQELVPLMNDALLKVTIAHWVTPNGTVIEKNGITPDVNLSTTTPEESGSDAWLQAAVEELAKKL